MAQLQLTFCDAHKYTLDKESFDGSIAAIAELLIESHIVCDATGNYALACAKTWASATSFAGSAYQGALHLPADVRDDCHRVTLVLRSLPQLDACHAPPGAPFYGSHMTLPQRCAAYATAWNSIKTGTTCSCDVDIYASADATVSGWAEIWAGIYAKMDDAACVGTGARSPASQRAYLYEGAYVFAT